MPLDYTILKRVGTTDERLREIFTADPARIDESLPADDPSRVKIETDYRVRKKYEELFMSRVQEAITDSMKNYHLDSAADLAWDATTITGDRIPLMMYAQRRLSVAECANTLSEVGKTEYLKRNEKGDMVVDLPKFLQVETNLIRSIVTRRVAAQMNRFNNLWPLMKYDSRSTRPEAKLRADALSQRMDIAADQFDYRRHHEQIARDLMLYSRAYLFPRCRWERDVEWYQPDVAAEFDVDNPTKNFKSRVVREGVSFVQPHPNRVVSDPAHPPQTINSDTGCQWILYWGISRYGDIKHEPSYFNRDSLGFNAIDNQFAQSNYAYFEQYFPTILTTGSVMTGPAEANNRDAHVGASAGVREDAACFLTHLFQKVVPIEIGCGLYPYPVWIHFTIAGESGTIVHAEIMPDTPAFRSELNVSTHRKRNLSMAHDLMGHQDQMNNLTNLMLAEVNRDLMAVFCLNTDVWDHNDEAKKARDEFLDAIRSGEYDRPLIICGSFTKLRSLLGDNAVTADNILKVIRTQPNTAIDNIFRAMAQVMQLAERMVALSPQEQGQVSPRETSATEVQVVATTTENVYSYISDAIDAFRAAWKRYLYNAFVSCATDNITVPVIQRYPVDVATRAGFEYQTDELITDVPGRSYGGTVTGSKLRLIEEYVFTTRDGAERSSNIQSAQALTQLLQVVLSTPAAAAIKKGKFFEILNEIARLGGSGVDLDLTAPEAEADQPIVSPMAQQGGSPPALPSPQGLVA